MNLQIRHADGRLEPVRRIVGRYDGSALRTLLSSLPPGADLLEPGEHLPVTSYRPPDPVA